MHKPAVSIHTVHLQHVLIGCRLIPSNPIPPAGPTLALGVLVHAGALARVRRCAGSGKSRRRVLLLLLGFAAGFSLSLYLSFSLALSLSPTPDDESRARSAAHGGGGGRETRIVGRRGLKEEEDGESGERWR